MRGKRGSPASGDTVRLRAWPPFLLVFHFPVPLLLGSLFPAATPSPHLPLPLAPQPHSPSAPLTRRLGRPAPPSPVARRLRQHAPVGYALCRVRAPERSRLNVPEGAGASLDFLVAGNSSLCVPAPGTGSAQGCSPGGGTGARTPAGSHFHPLWAPLPHRSWDPPPRGAPETLRWVWVPPT